MNKFTKPLLILSTTFLLSPFLVGCNSGDNKEEEIISYTVTFLNYDETVLHEDIVKKGEDAVYHGKTPIRPDDANYQYEFTGWDKSLTNILEDTVFTAQYKATNDYAVNFYDVEGGTLLYRDYVSAGETASYEGETPKKEATYEYYYTFTGWDKSLENISSNLDVIATYEEKSNFKDYDESYEYWVYKFADKNNLDPTNSSFCGTGRGLNVFLNKPVLVRGEYKEYYRVDFASGEISIDLSNLDTSHIGEYETTITYRGISRKEVIDVIPDSDKFEDEPVNHFSDGGLPNVPAPDWYNVVTMDFYRYKDGDDEEYTVINGVYSELYLHDYFEKDDKRYMSFYRIYNGVSENVIYKLRTVGTSGTYLRDYDFPGHESEIGKVTIVKGDKERQLAIHQELDDAASAYGQLEETVYTSIYRLAVKYDYDKDKKTLKIHQQDYPNIFVLEADGKFHYQY